MRSPLTETVHRVQGMVTYVQENLSSDEYNLFLDLLVPEPEPAVKVPTKKKRKSGGKSQRASSLAATLDKSKPPRVPMCVACGNPSDHADHGSGQGQHEFSTEIGTRIVDQLKHHEAKCGFEVDGKVCHGAEGDAIHDPKMGYGGHHEFQPEQVAGRWR